MDWMSPLKDNRWRLISNDGTVKVLGTLEELKTPRILAVDKMRRRQQLEAVVLTALKHRGKEWT